MLFFNLISRAMESKEKRKPVLHLFSQEAKRRKVDDEGRGCVKSPGTTYSEPSISFAIDSSNLNRSGLPARLMFYERGEWKDFSPDSSAALRVAFEARKSFTELSLDGKRYLVSFPQMLLLNLLTGYVRSIAWIDVYIKCFFPSECVEGYGTHLPISAKPCLRKLDSYQGGCMKTKPSHLQKSASGATPSIDLSQESLIGIDSCVPESSAATAFSQVISCHDGISSHSLNNSSTTTTTIASPEATSSDVTSHLRDAGGQAVRHTGSPAVHQSQDFALLHDKIIRLDEAEPEFTDIQYRFFMGLGMLATHTTITAIHKNCHRSTSGHVRQSAFMAQEEITRKTRGGANVRYAWYDTSRQEVSSIVLHGFGRPKIPKHGAMYGVGVYLAPEDCSHVSAVYSEVDENGEHHVVLCRVIMGSMEQVCRGSEQFHPSSEDYDCGVDDLCNPKRYIVWSTHMNTHIVPEYIVSFKLAPPWQAGIIAALKGKQMVGGLKRTTESGRSRTDIGHRSTRSVKVKDAVYSPCISETLEANPGAGCRGPRPRSPWMSFPMLFLVLKSKLPPASMDALQQHYLDFKGGRMSRCAFIKIVRSIAGDNLVANVIRSMQTQVLDSVLMQNRIVDDRVVA